MKLLLSELARSLYWPAWTSGFLRRGSVLSYGICLFVLTPGLHALARSARPGQIPAAARQTMTAADWQKRGESQLEDQQYSQAIESFASALALQPDSKAAKKGEVDAAIANALKLRANGDQNGALATLMHAIQEVPDSPELLTDFGIQAYEMHIYQDADRVLTKAHQLDPSNVKTLYALAHVELDEQNTSAAQKHLAEYLKQRPDDATAHYGMGHLLHMISQDDAAVAQMERSIALQPHQIASYYELGVIALEREHDPEARAKFTYVLSLDPHHGRALTGMGILAFRDKDFEQAADYLSKAVRYAPNYVTAHSYYAMTLTRLGRKAEAAQEMAKVQTLMAQQSRLSHGYMIQHNP